MSTRALSGRVTVGALGFVAAGCLDFDALDRCYGGTCTEDAGSTVTDGETPGPVRAGPGVKPDERTTGVPPGTALVPIEHDVTVTEDSAVIDGQDIHGKLIIRARDVRVTRTRVRGRSDVTDVVVDAGAAENLLIEDSEITIDAPNGTAQGLWGSSLTARRVHVHVASNGMTLQGSATLEYSFVHGTSFAVPKASLVHVVAANQVRLIGNQLAAAGQANAALQVSQETAHVDDLLVDANWASGGQCSFNFALGRGTAFQATVQNNRFMGNTAYACPIIKGTAVTLIGGGNVWDDTGAPVPVVSRD